MNNYDLEDSNVDLSQSYIESLMEDEKIKKYVKKKKTEEEEDQFVLQLLINFIGPKYEKIFKSKFSIPGFLLGSLYLLYRKIYLLGFIYLLSIVLVMTFFINNSVVLLALLIVTFIINLLIGIGINKRYLDFAYNKVKKIEDTNSSLPDEAIVSLCKRKGGTSLFISAILIVIATIISVSIYFGTHSFNITNKTNNLNISYNNNINLESELIFETYEVFVKNQNSTNGHHIYYTNGCELDIGVLRRGTSFEKIVDDITEEYDTTLNTEMINNKYWTVLNKDDTLYYLLTNNNNNIYLVKYSVTDNNYKDSCLNYYNAVKSSLTIN